MIPYELRVCLSRDQLFHHLVEAALQDPANGFPVLADHVEESGMPTLAGILRNYHEGDPPQPNWWHFISDSNWDYGDEPEDDGSPHASISKIKRSPELIPGVHLVPVNRSFPRNWDHGKKPKEVEGMANAHYEGGYHLFDMRGHQTPDGDGAYRYDVPHMQEVAASIPRPHYFGARADAKGDAITYDKHELDAQ